MTTINTGPQAFTVSAKLFLICITRILIRLLYLERHGPGSSVGITTGYGLDGPGIESRWGRDLTTCPDRSWGPPSLLYNGYRVSFPGVKQPRRGVDQSPHLGPRLKKE
jgi:hypothetical protein